MTDLEIIATTAVVIVIFAVKIWILTKIQGNKMIHQNVQKLINDYQTILDRDPLDQMEDTQSILVRFAQQLAAEMGEIVVAVFVQ